MAINWYSKILRTKAAGGGGGATIATNTFQLNGIENVDSITFTQDVTAGGTGALDSTIQGSDDGGTTWYNLGTFTQVTTGAGLEAKKPTAVLPLMRVNTVLADAHTYGIKISFCINGFANSAI